MLSSGDVVTVDFGLPEGREAGFRHPAVLITAQRILDGGPAVVHVVPVTSNVRDFASEVALDPEPATGLPRRSAVQCQHIRSVSRACIDAVIGNVGPLALHQIRETVGSILDIE